MTYLVTGATGNVGARAVEQLLAVNERPRIFVRSAEKARARFGDRVDIAVGDLSDATALNTALAQVNGLLLITAGTEIAAHDRCAASAAKNAGVAHIVKISSMDVERTGGIGAWHAEGEAAIRESSIPFTFVRPTGFMSNALAWAASIQTTGIVRASTGDGKIAMIHPDDIASVAVNALTARRHDGQTLTITGSEALTYDEMVRKISAAVGKPLAFQSISDEAARVALIEHRVPLPVADSLVSLWRAVREGQTATVTNTVEQVLGRKPISFDRWAEENVRAFI